MQGHDVHNLHAMRNRGELIARAAFARFDLVALGTAMGCVGALALWVATAVLLLKGAPPGVSVGPHLALLSNFFPAYSVSWPGSFVGLVYGFVVGFGLGTLIAVLWNVAHHIYFLRAVTRGYFADDL